MENDYPYAYENFRVDQIEQLFSPEDVKKVFNMEIDERIAIELGLALMPSVEFLKGVKSKEIGNSGMYKDRDLPKYD